MVAARRWHDEWLDLNGVEDDDSAFVRELEEQQSREVATMQAAWDARRAEAQRELEQRRAGDRVAALLFLGSTAVLVVAIFLCGFALGRMLR